MAEENPSEFDRAAEQVIGLGNRLSGNDDQTDDWEIASGLLTGAVQFWLYSHDPCGDPNCESCEEISTAAQRLSKLLDETRQSAEESEYFHSPRDADAGTA